MTTRSVWNEVCAVYEMAKLDAEEEVESNEECMLLGEALSESTWALLNAAAPSVAALAYKLQVLRDEEAYNLNAAREILDVLIADARRLEGRGSC